MRLVLDTHAIIWWLLDDPMLSRAADQAIRRTDATVYVSAVIAWEIATKVRKGQMPAMAGSIATFVDDVTSEGFHHLLVKPDHGLQGGLLVGDHKDPFDRLIAAQALMLELTVVTRDPAFRAFGCEVLW